ncbi:MAG: glycoside hydrolase domain-containing protein [Nocardioidaceae bacterium]
MVVLLSAVALLPSSPAQADTRVMPGSITGYAFDTCQAPSQRNMDAWLEASPYWGVGIYIAGINRFCFNQPLLTPQWLQTQSDNGWRILPLTVGLQASCSTNARFQAPGRRINPNPAGDYAAARSQGGAEARSTVSVARSLGIAAGSTLWYDLEHFDASKMRCRDSALAFISGWTSQLHVSGYRSGFYSSGSSGIRALDNARVLTPRRFDLPDQIWIADWNGRADVNSAYVRPDGWMPHARVHQYRGDHLETYGGVTINIDSNFMDVGRGSVAPPEPSYCGGVSLNYPSYQMLAPGSTGGQVTATQCLLKLTGDYNGALGSAYTRETELAVRAYQSRHSLPVNGTMTASTWTALLSEGATPLIKFGSAEEAVRRLQRALNASVGARLSVTGVFNAATTSAVRTYQANRGLPRTGVADPATWAGLRAGRR